ncbi:MAG: hypothetical protein HND44_23590, partial [Chloroflexi bacterium]|nr:hypothetical protein [Chloroflexota bacterium]NOG37527.1 hypothetical protein [Chloroflexota bacterium]
MDDEQDTQKPIVNPEDDTPVGKRPLPPPPPPPPDEAETVSLFDLMDAADDPTITLSSMTDEAAKAAAQTGPTVPPPLAAPELTPRERPPMYDMDATQVRPDLAIPGNRQTTQPAQPPTTQAPPQQPPTRQQYPAQPPPPAQSTARPQPPAQPARQQPVYPQQPVRQAAPARQVGPARQAAPHS